MLGIVIEVLSVFRLVGVEVEGLWGIRVFMGLNIVIVIVISNVK